MTIELTYLGWALVLALVQIGLAAGMRSRETGFMWAAGPRDTAPPKAAGKITARLIRAQHNMLETLPIFIGLVLALQVANIHSPKTHLGVMLYFWGRLAYLPIYGLGWRYVRTVAWVVSIIGLIMLLCAGFCGR